MPDTTEQDSENSSKKRVSKKKTTGATTKKKATYSRKTVDKKANDKNSVQLEAPGSNGQDVKIEASKPIKPRKKTSSVTKKIEMEQKATNKRSRIYQDLVFNYLPDYYNRDILKILIKNPKEAFAFWGISSGSFESIKKALNTDLNDVYLKLILYYTNTEKHHIDKVIDLPPFTNNFLIKFDEPIKNLKAEIAAYNKYGQYYVLLQSALINMPSSRPSMEFHKDWISERWLNEGLLEEQEGEWKVKSYWKFEASEEEFYHKFFGSSLLAAIGAGVEGGLVGASEHIGSSSTLLGSSNNNIKGN
ncbi:MAG: DUF4912 domain-containing protein [Leptospiraceae bacterium]|nr:DUF4912 domain-containing protein [Leptospiraceae bacterium]MCP5494493.1 DUF4912 domain-containing protein [Leptospiraceae bacterium]